MPDVNVPYVGLTAELEEEDAIKDAIEELLSETGDFAPRSIIISAPYAKYVEFGSNPAKGSKASNSEVWKELDKWLRDKMGIIDDKERRRALWPVYRKIMEEGIPPQPFIRPAIHKTLATIGDDWFANGGTMQELAEIIVRVMKNNLELNRTNYTGKLRDSIYIVTGAVEGDSDLENIPADVWAKDDVGADGTRKAAHYGGTWL